MSIASNTSAVTSWKPYQYTGFGFTNNNYGGTSSVDTNRTAAAVASNYQNAAESQYGSAIGGLQSLVDSLSGSNPAYSTLQGQLDGSFANLDKASGSLMDVYGSLGGARDTLNGYANQLGSLHDTIGQISDNVNPVFAALTGIGTNLRGIAGGVFWPFASAHFGPVK